MEHKRKQEDCEIHVLSAICPQPLEEWLESQSSHKALQKDFEQFSKHAVKLSNAFQFLNFGLEKKLGKAITALSVIQKQISLTGTSTRIVRCRCTCKSHIVGRELVCSWGIGKNSHSMQKIFSRANIIWVSRNKAVKIHLRASFPTNFSSKAPAACRKNSWTTSKYLWDIGILHHARGWQCHTTMYRMIWWWCQLVDRIPSPRRIRCL